MIVDVRGRTDERRLKHLAAVEPSIGQTTVEDSCRDEATMMERSVMKVHLCGRLRSSHSNRIAEGRIGRCDRVHYCLACARWLRHCERMADRLTDEETARALSYLDALDRENFAPTRADIEAYVDNPVRSKGSLRLSGTFEAMNILAWTLSNLSVSSPPTAMTDYLLALRWVELRGSGGQNVGLTPLGRAVARSVARTAVEHDEVIETLLLADDPMALARVIQRISATGPGMLVDPYFRFDQLLRVFQHSSITRVLTSEHLSKSDRDALVVGVQALQGRAMEVRMGDKTLHDRHLIGDDGKVVALGSSMSSAGKRTSIITEVRDGSSAIADFYNDAWKNAEVLGCTSLTANDTATAIERESIAVDLSTTT